MKKPADFEKLYSKKDFQELLFAILNPLKPFYSEGKASVQIGVTMAHYDMKATWMETFSRPLWGLVPFWAGGGREIEFEQIYRSGLKNGTNKLHPEYWGDCVSFDQRFVEMAAIAYGILFAPQFIWNPLSEMEKENVCNYLNQINQNRLPACNWILFAVLVNLALKKRDCFYREDILEGYLEDLETFYLGDGWYKDGDSGQKDYYISFAIHFYSLLYAKIMEKDDPERVARYKERACQFAQQFVYWFDEKGDAIPFGRSLTYRFSQVSFFSACLLADIEPFPIPVMKGLIVRHLKSWIKRPIFDRDGILTIGYGYPNLMMAERYNAPGSPYWALKTFAFLMLPDEHAFWTAEEASFPALKPECAMPYADMFIRHYKNHTTAFVPGSYSPNGHGQIVAKYGKFAYDSRCSISIAKSNYELCENAPDNMLAFVIHGYVYVRRICKSFEITQNGIGSVWSPYPGIEVETRIIPNEVGHIREHSIKSSISDCIAYDCGFSIDRGDFTPIGYQEHVEKNSIMISNQNVCCKMSSEFDKGKGEVLLADPNTNLLYTKTAIPMIKYQIQTGSSFFRTYVELEVL